MDTLGLSQFKIPIGKIAAQTVWQDRASDSHSYRFYPAWSENLVVLYHGIGADSKYLALLASSIAESGVAQVITPDLRGHGVSLGSSDLISESQLEVDLEELFIHLKFKHPIQNVVLAGHSMGGAFALRCAQKNILPEIKAAWALVPYLRPEWHLHQENWGRWISFEGEQILVNMPEIFKTGSEKLRYSKEYLKAVEMPEDFFEQRIKKPCFVSLAGKDPIYKNNEAKERFTSVEGLRTLYFEEANHFSIVMRKDVIQSHIDMLQGIFV